MGYHLGMPVTYGKQQPVKNEFVGDVEAFRKWFDIQNMDFAMVYIDSMWEVHAMHRVDGKTYAGEPCDLLTSALQSAYTFIMRVFKEEGIQLHANRPEVLE
jgi:hypothetical protein